MSTPSLAHDLALKRTVHAPVEQKPHFAWRDVLAGEEIALPAVVLLCPHGEERFVLAEVADTLGKALTNVSLARGDQEIFTDANRAWVVRICRELAVNLRELARNRTPCRLTLNALYELIEKTLVDNNAYFVAKSLLLNRARKLSFDREATAQTTFRVIRRNNQVVPWNEQKVEIAIRKTFLSLQRDSAPAVAITRAVGERVQASQAGLSPHRGDPGPGPGGVDEGRPLQGGRGLHPIPGRAGRRPRRQPGAVVAPPPTAAPRAGDHGRRQAGERRQYLLGRRRSAQADRVRPHRPGPVPVQRPDRGRIAAFDLRPDLPEGSRRHDRPEFEDPDRAGRRFLQVRRPHPAYLPVRGGPRLEHHARTASAS